VGDFSSIEVGGFWVDKHTHRWSLREMPPHQKPTPFRHFRVFSHPTWVQVSGTFHMLANGMRETFNTDHGSQFTSEGFTGLL